MYDKLRQVIKTDPKSQEIFGEFLDEFYARQRSQKVKANGRMRITTLVLACCALINLFFMVYAYIRAEQLEFEMVELRMKLENCESN